MDATTEKHEYETQIDALHPWIQRREVVVLEPVDENAKLKPGRYVEIVCPDGGRRIVHFAGRRGTALLITPANAPSLDHTEEVQATIVAVVKRTEMVYD